MPGRHTAPNMVGRRQHAGVGKWIVLGVVVLVAIGLGVFAITAALVSIAQAQVTKAQRQSSAERLGEVTREGGVAISTEQQMLDYNARNSGANLASTVPQALNITDQGAVDSTL